MTIQRVSAGAGAAQVLQRMSEAETRHGSRFIAAVLSTSEGLASLVEASTTAPCVRIEPAQLESGASQIARIMGMSSPLVWGTLRGSTLNTRLALLA